MIMHFGKRLFSTAEVSGASGLGQNMLRRMAEGNPNWSKTIGPRVFLTEQFIRSGLNACEDEYQSFVASLESKTEAVR